MTKQTWLNRSFVSKLLEVDTWVMFLRAPFNFVRMALLKLLVGIISAFALGNIVIILALISCGKAVVKFGWQVRQYCAMYFELD